MNAPTFSIVIPVYNREALLCERLSTIFHQKYSNFEVLVIDDGSAHELAPILQKTFPDENRLLTIRQENRERGAARNLGFRSAKGSYVVFFDSDDIMHENYLETLHEYIIKLNEPDYLACQYDFVDDSGNNASSDCMKLSEGNYDYKLFLTGNPLACNVCVKKNNPKYIPFPEDRNFAIKEDWLFLISNLRFQKIYIIPVVTLSMYDHHERSMRSDNRLIIERTHKAARWIETTITLTSKEIRILRAHENYFCGIHWYLDENRKESVVAALTAMKTGGIQMKYFSLLIKALIGRKLILKLK